jgi:hypothetical protein
VNAGGEILGDLLMAGTALILVIHGRMFDKLTRMGLLLITRFSISIVTACTSHGIMTRGFIGIIPVTTQVYPVIRFIVRSIPTATPDRSSCIRRMYGD